MANINVNDFTVDYVNKLIRYDGSETPPYLLSEMLSVNALYSYLQDTFDELNQMDDDIPMSAQTPTDYTLINGWFIDEKSIQCLKGGAITTNGWTNEIQILNVDGITTHASIPADVGKTVNDDASPVGELLYAEEISSTEAKWWIRSSSTIGDGSTMTIDGSSADGTANGASTSGNNLWTNLYTLGTLYGTPTLYITRDDERLSQSGTGTAAWWDTGHIDILILIKEGGTEIGDKLAGGDTGWVQVFDRDWTDGDGSLWDWFEVDLGPGGRQAVPLATFSDLNNTTAASTVATWTDITVGTAGPYSKDIGDGSGPQNYDYSIDCGGRALSQVYERLKYITRDGETSLIDGVEGQQYTVVVGQEGTYAPSKQAPFGTFAGGIFFGARGIWIENMAGADAEKYQLIDSAGVTRNPPTQAPITVSSVVAGDRVLVAKSTGAASTVIDKTQFTISGTIPSGADYIHVTVPIPNDTPTSGFIRVVDTGVSEERYTFSGWTDHTFGLNVTTTKEYVGPTDTAWVPYIDNEATSTSIVQPLIYVTDRNLVARVRKYGILPFETVATLVTGGVTITAIRTEDTIVA